MSQAILIRLSVLFGLGLPSLLSCGNTENGAQISSRPAVNASPEQSLPRQAIEGAEDSPIHAFSVDQGGAAAGGEHLNQVWLNFDGASLSASESLVLRQWDFDNIQIPSFASSDLGAAYLDDARSALQEEILANVRSRFQPYELEIFSDKSELSPGPYTTVHIGGKNFGPIEGLLGISPLDIGNYEASDILFVFSAELETRQTSTALDVLVNTITHELSHSFGTRHLAAPQANLSPEIFSSSTLFDISAPRSETPEENENTHEILLNNLGAQNSSTSSSTALVRDLMLHRQNDVGQMTPRLAAGSLPLNKMRFVWREGDRQWPGRVLRMKFPDTRVRHLQLEVYLKSEKNPLETHYYQVGRKN
jgi:hypothetical protein